MLHMHAAPAVGVIYGTVTVGWGDTNDNVTEG
jgi:hypothetical protein